MRKLLHTIHRNQKGFTLLELLVVIGILAVLIAIVAFNVGEFIGKGACESYCVERHDLQTAVIAYMAHYDGTVPTVEQADTYLIGNLKHTWTDANIAENGFLSDAADKPEGCVCGGE